MEISVLKRATIKILKEIKLIVMLGENKANSGNYNANYRTFLIELINVL